MTDKCRILIIEDDLRLVQTIKAGISGYSLTYHDDLPSLESYTPGRYQILMVDETLPSGSGCDFVAQLREIDSEIQIVCMTGCSEPSILKKYLNSQVQYFLEKPFRLDELKSILQKLTPKNCFQIGPNLALSVAEKRVFLNGTPLDLTAKEYLLTETLALAGGQALRKEELVARIWNLPHLSPNVFDTHLSNLRKKYPLFSNHIINQRGLGYRWSQN